MVEAQVGLGLAWTAQGLQWGSQGFQDRLGGSQAEVDAPSLIDLGEPVGGQQDRPGVGRKPAQGP